MPSGLHDPAKLRQQKFKLPYIGDLTWEPDPTQRKAAWALYVELTTRIATQPLDLDHGLLREAMTSLHFTVTRGILREAGPDVGSGPNRVGGVAIKVLNGAIAARSSSGAWSTSSAGSSTRGASARMRPSCRT